jgi:hypothetical protein
VVIRRRCSLLATGTGELAAPWLVIRWTAPRVHRTAIRESTVNTGSSWIEQGQVSSQLQRLAIHLVKRQATGAWRRIGNGQASPIQCAADRADVAATADIQARNSALLSRLKTVQDINQSLAAPLLLGLCQLKVGNADLYPRFVHQPVDTARLCATSRCMAKCWANGRARFNYPQ